MAARHAAHVRRDRAVFRLAAEKLAEAVRDFETDDVVYLLEDLEEDAQRKVLEALDNAESGEAARALADLAPAAYRPFNLLLADPVETYWLNRSPPR